MNRFSDKVRQAAAWIASRIDCSPLIGVITGTGLGEAVGPLEDLRMIGFGDIPHFPVSTAVGHPGRMMVGRLEGCPMAIMQGRVHLYEGYNAWTVTFPVRVMQALGVRCLMLTNAAGGINPALAQGDLMVIRDHINLSGENPLVGLDVEAWGPRFPDMTAAYDPILMQLTDQAAKHHGIVLQRGVYAGLKGPSLETPAEIRFLKTIGADAVGFSTVMETIAAVHAGIRVLGLSTITNFNDPDHPAPASAEAIVAAARHAAPTLKRLIEAVVRSFVHELTP